MVEVLRTMAGPVHDPCRTQRWEGSHRTTSGTEVERVLLVLAMFDRTPTLAEIAGVADGTELAYIAHGLLTSPNYPT